MAGVDKINIYTVKLCTPFLLHIIAYIINVCITKSTFPCCWKKAYVLPILKIKKPNEIKDLRSVSILPTLSKTMERIMEQQMRKFVEEQQLLPCSQSGFRKGYSCATALLRTSDIIISQDQNKLTALVLLDYSKAFDTINQNVWKLFCIIMNYLTGRYQAVKICDRRGRSVNLKLKELGWLDMYHRREYHAACLFHRVIVSRVPPYLYKDITFRTDVHNLNLSHRGLISIPVHHFEFAKRSFIHNVAKTYNCIPKCTVRNFPKDLKIIC